MLQREIIIWNKITLQHGTREQINARRELHYLGREITVCYGELYFAKGPGREGRWKQKARNFRKLFP